MGVFQRTSPPKHIQGYLFVNKRMTSLQNQNQQPSRLPVKTKDKTNVRAGSRRALGDITGIQTNKPSKPLQQGDGKSRVTRVAARRLTVSAQPEPIQIYEEPMEVEAEKSEPERVFPEGVEDIDSQDFDNPQLCSEYALEMFAYLRQLEGRGSVKAAHLAGCPTNDKMRAVLVDWLVEVQLQFKLLQETLFGTVDIIDRYLAIEGKTVTRSRLQLIGVATMFLASKIEEVYAPACSDFVYITDNAYTEDETKATELRIVKALEFNLSQPVAINFLRRYSKAGDVDVLQHSLAKYSLELSLTDYELVPVPGSKLAAAALCLSLLLLEPQEKQSSEWGETLVYYSGYSKEELKPTVSRLAKTISSAFLKSSNMEAIRTKYRGAKFMKVADLPELKGEVLARLVSKKR